jgi:membrane-bound serine protease (ClpP class)
MTSNATAFLRSIAVKRNRNVAEAEKGVVESKSFTDGEALEKNLIDLVAKDEAELLSRLEGYKIRMFSGEERILHPAGRPITDYDMTARQKFLSTISQPNLALLLGLAGVILLYFEFSNPGFVAPGVIGGICLLLSILGFSFLPINYVGVLLLLFAIGLFVAEVKVQGFGILGFGGVVSLVIGILILIDAADPAVRIGLKTAILAGLPFALIFTILLVALFRSLNQKVSTGNEGMVGLTGIADNDIDSKGRVRIRGEYWTACSDSPIANLTLRVEEVRS